MAVPEARDGSVEPAYTLVPAKLQAFDQAYTELVELGIELYKIPICQALYTLDEPEIANNPNGIYPNGIRHAEWTIREFVRGPMGQASHNAAWANTLAWLVDHRWILRSSDLIRQVSSDYYALRPKGKRELMAALLA